MALKRPATSTEETALSPKQARTSRNVSWTNISNKCLYSIQTCTLIVLFSSTEISPFPPVRTDRPSSQKLCMLELFQRGMQLSAISQHVGIQAATAEVYTIDCLGAGMKLDHEVLVTQLGVTPELFARIKSKVAYASRLREIKDIIDESTYNQIRFIIACMIHDLLI